MNKYFTGTSTVGGYKYPPLYVLVLLKGVLVHRTSVSVIDRA
jgi:hypothetical protein